LSSDRTKDPLETGDDAAVEVASVAEGRGVARMAVGVAGSVLVAAEVVSLVRGGVMVS
jgi:hypothetical protein